MTNRNSFFDLFLLCLPPLSPTSETAPPRSVVVSRRFCIVVHDS